MLRKLIDRTVLAIGVTGSVHDVAAGCPLLAKKGISPISARAFSCLVDGLLQKLDSSPFFLLWGSMRKPRLMVLRRVLVGLAFVLPVPSATHGDGTKGTAETPLAAPAASPSVRDAALQRELHHIELADPVLPSAPARRCDLVLRKDRRGFPVEYCLSFKTQVCTDGQCKLVEVTMTWNAVGYFVRLQYPPGKPLTKKDHVPFTSEDYAKLDRILKTRDSILRDWTLDYLERPAEMPDGVDAVTQPTPVTVRDSVIQDAAYTTWALWRWANGAIVPKLLAITRQHCTPEYLKYLLVSPDRRFADFALDHMLEQRPCDPQYVEGVCHILENGERDQIDRALEFLSRAIPDKEKLCARLIESCCRMRSADCPLVLQMLAAEPELPASAIEKLTGRLKQFPYFPVHLILRMLEERRFASDKTIADVVQLLDSDNFFIARRAYEHLARQELDAPTAKRVGAFRERNQDRL